MGESTTEGDIPADEVWIVELKPLPSDVPAVQRAKALLKRAKRNHG